MRDDSEAFVAFDTFEVEHAVAIAEGGRAGEVRFLGEIETTEAASCGCEEAGGQVRPLTCATRPADRYGRII